MSTESKPDNPREALAFARKMCCEERELPQAQLERAACLKSLPKGAEELLWSCLSGKQLLGYTFTRKHNFGDFIADFFCEKAQLIINLGEDASRKDKSPACDCWARQNGFRLIRFYQCEVLQNVEQVINVLGMALRIVGSPKFPKRPSGC